MSPAILSFLSFTWGGFDRYASICAGIEDTIPKGGTMLYCGYVCVDQSNLALIFFVMAIECMTSYIRIA